VDGSASNDSGHMLGETRLAMLLQRVTKGPNALGAREALEIATLGGASILGRDDIGSLAPGMAADLVAFDLNTIDRAGAQSDPTAALLFCSPSRVDLSMINGRLVVQDGRLLDIDLPHLIEEHNALGQALLQ